MSNNQIAARQVTTADNLDDLVEQINRAQWDDANDMADYEVCALSSYLERPDTVFIACYDHVIQPPNLLGIASGRLEMKPYDGSFWLYVDEVDVCVDQRQRGAGTQLMRAMQRFARAHECDELWLGTEPDNVAANALYRALQPSEEEAFIGYTYSFE